MKHLSSAACRLCRSSSVSLVTSVFSSPELSSRRPPGGGLWLHGQNPGGAAIHHHRGGLLTLRLQVQDPRPRELRPVPDH